MLEKLGLRAGVIAVAVAALVIPSFGQVVKVRDFNLSAPRDRMALFGIAITPSGDVLSFIAKNRGEWQLYRVRNWYDGTPLEDRLLLPGYFSKEDRTDLENLTAQVFVTADGAYAVCSSSAEWLKRVRGRAVGRARSDDVISVVDLATFKVVSSTRTRALGLLEYHEVKLDHHGHVLVDSLSQDKPMHSVFIQLDIPSLVAGTKCGYHWVEDSPSRQHPEPITESECRESLKSMTLEQYLREGRFPSAQKSSACENNSAEFCRIPGEFTADGKFGVGDRSDGHDNFLGSWVTTSYSYVIFSASKRVDVGEIKEPTNDSLRRALVPLNGRDYLIVVQGGTHLNVYELRE
jgi:hypothetical protein